MLADKNQVFTTHHQHLRSLAYRLLGSKHDAEDIVQEAWFRWQQTEALPQHNLAYLRRIVTNLSVDLLRQRQRERQEYTGSWLPEPEMSESLSELANPEHIKQQQQTVSLAFLHMLEQLNPVERAVFVLREAFDDEFSDIADYLNIRPDNCRQIFSRARRKVQDSPALHEDSSEQHQQLLMTFLMACQQGDVALLQQHLSKDAVLYSDGGGKVKAALRPIFGADKSIRLLFALARKQSPHAELTLRGINGRLALVATLAGQTQYVLSLCVQNGKIETVYMLLNPEKLTTITT
ncbi:MAG: RNA polymerase sigma factor SigJ [Agitococcus sp.]|nr:RNA polymerase sigma factor SigJ [Agitococcus sp.]